MARALLWGMTRNPTLEDNMQQVVTHTHGGASVEIELPSEGEVSNVGISINDNEYELELSADGDSPRTLARALVTDLEVLDGIRLDLSGIDREVLEMRISDLIDGERDALRDEAKEQAAELIDSVREDIANAVEDAAKELETLWRETDSEARERELADSTAMEDELVETRARIAELEADLVAARKDRDAWRTASAGQQPRRCRSVSPDERERRRAAGRKAWATICARRTAAGFAPAND